MRLTACLLLVALAPLTSLACSAASTDPTEAPPAPTAAPTTAPTTAPPGAPSVAKGVWQAFALPTKADVNAIFSPHDGLVFFGTSEGMFRFDGKATTKVDLGCTCSVEDFDRDTGLALGTDGTNVYAGVFDGVSGYKPFAWQTPRGGPKPARVAGDASSFIYVSTDHGRTVRYDPTALFGSARFGIEASGGDLLGYNDTTNAVYGSVGNYWVAGNRGMYSHSDNFHKATDGDFSFMDVWNGWALRLGGGSAYMCGYNGSAWTIDIEITAPHGTPYRFFQHAANGALVDEWILSKRLDGGSGTGASPATYGGAIGHVDTSLVWSWVDFPKNEELTSAAFTEKEQWVVGRGGIVYRCLQPGCELAKSAPPGG